MNMVTVKKCAELTGYSEKAIQNKIDRGIWKINIHYVKAPDGRRLINLRNVEAWILTDLIKNQTQS